MSSSKTVSSDGAETTRASRNVLLLPIAYALALSTAPLIVLVGGIVGGELAPSPTLATAPIAAMIIGVATATIPASALMARYGRRAGFVGSSIAAALSAALGMYALEAQSFALFCVAAALLGSNLAFVQQYRFAAAESVPHDQVGRAVAWVLAGGVAAALIGPEIGARTEHWAGHADYALTFASLAGVYALVAVLLVFLQDVVPETVEAEGPRRRLLEIVTQRRFLLAALAATIAYGVMSFVMTATPVSMHSLDGHGTASAKTVIQWHMLGMYLPTLVAGGLIARLGITRLIGLGLAAMAAGLVTTQVGHGVPVYWIALVLVGVGWSLQFLGATVLLTRTYRPSERFAAQAVNDFSVFAVQAVAALSAGAVLHRAGWEVVNLSMLVPLGILAVALVIWRNETNDPSLALSAELGGELATTSGSPAATA